MEITSTTRPVGGMLWRAAAAVTAGVLLYCAAMLEPWWWAAWLAPIPLLVAAFHASARGARWLAMAAGLIGALATAPYYAIATGFWGSTLIVLLRALAWGFVVGRTRDAVVRSGRWPVVFLYPALWAGLDTVITALSPHGSDGTMVFSQSRALPVMQLAAWTGAAGVVFIFSLFAAVAAVAIHRGRRRIDRPWLAYGLPAALILLAIGGGAARLATRPGPAGPALTVGLAAIDRGPAMESPEPEGRAADAMWDAYGQAVAGLAARGAQLVALPEKIAIVEPAAAGALQRRLGAMARTTGVYLIAGVDVWDRRAGGEARHGRRENRAWLFSPRGELLADYAKQHPVPGLEAAYTPGHTDLLLPLAGHRGGVVICKDLDFPDLSRRYARAGASIVLQPAWDFDQDGWWRVDIAALRSVESGFTVVHATRNGVMAVTDRYGRRVAGVASSSAPVATLLTAAPLGPGRATPYARFGDWFGWLCVVGCAAAVRGGRGTGAMERAPIRAGA
jgi:apolipoprotein N-acyltransferase